MYIHVRVRLEKVWKKLKKKKVEKIFTKNFTSCPSKREKKKFWYFPRGQRPERGLRLPKVLLKPPRLLTNGPTPHRNNIQQTTLQAAGGEDVTSGGDVTLVAHTRKVAGMCPHDGGWEH